jgi:hypothetical protein
MNDRARTLTQADIDAATGWRPAAIAHAGGAGYDDGEPAPAHTTRMVLGLSAIAMIGLITLVVAVILAHAGRMPWA